MVEIYRIKSCLQDYPYTSKGDWEELAELERLAEIGRATEKLFKAYAWVETIGEDFKSVEELLNWAKED